jgi:hypothetical protein
MDIFLAVVQAFVAAAAAYLGVHLTLHPPGESARAKLAYKAGFILCGLASIALIATQAYRNDQTQTALRGQLARIEKNTKTPPTVEVVNNVPPAQVIIQGPSEEKKQTGNGRARAVQSVEGANTQGASSQAPPTSPPGPPQTVEATPKPAPQVGRVRLANQRTIVSTDPEFPYGLEAVIQTDTNIEPVAFALACDGVIGKAIAGFSGGGAYFQTKSGQVNNDPKMFGFEWKSPAFTADNPIVVTIYSKGYVKVTEIQQIRYIWP